MAGVPGLRCAPEGDLGPVGPLADLRELRVGDLEDGGVVGGVLQVQR